MPVGQRRVGLSEVPERAFLLGWVDTGAEIQSLDPEMDELSDLARTAGAEVVGSDVQRRERPDPALFFGRGKVQELVALRAELAFDLVIANEELSPRQQRNLEQELEVKVLDRTELILDIFAQHARTREGRLQVAVAQLRHLMPRLSGGRDLSRLGGGIGTRGPGEQKLEADRRRIRTQLRRLDKELQEVRGERALHREGRTRRALRTVALVGYTNAGKSSLLNCLTAGGALTEHRLFATLDPRTRLLRLPGGQDCLLTDTVGFIQKLPHDLVAAFRATLEEVTTADVLIHVLDASQERAEQQLLTVHQTLAELDALERPRLLALNKVDRLSVGARTRLEMVPWEGYAAAAAVSALTGEGLGALASALGTLLADPLEPLDVVVPYTDPHSLLRWRRYGRIEHEEYTDQGVHVVGRVPPGLARALRGEEDGIEAGDGPAPASGAGVSRSAGRRTSGG
ncbi:MAG TPA: GTPase HflX [Candidatus Micrarchaeia archaeon]|nr:GTPase HflX [Candidatus Micrarchaeia archaeon]